MGESFSDIDCEMDVQRHIRRPINGYVIVSVQESVQVCARELIVVCMSLSLCAWVPRVGELQAVHEV